MRRLARHLFPPMLLLLLLLIPAGSVWVVGMYWRFERTWSSQILMVLTVSTLLGLAVWLPLAPGFASTCGEFSGRCGRR